MGLFDGLVNGLFSLGTSMVNNTMQAAQNREQRRFEHNETELANQFNAEQASINRQFQAEQNRINNDFNALEAQKSRDWELEMWNRQNEYNTPAHQLQLMMDAGINPMSFNMDVSPAGGVGSAQASSGTSPSGSSASATPVPAPPIIPLSIENPALAYLQGKQISKEVEKADSDIVKTQEETKKVIQDTVKQQLENDEFIKTQNVRIEGLELENKNKSKALDEATARIAQLEETVNTLKEQQHVYQEQAKLLVSQKQLTDKQVNSFDRRMHAEIANIIADTGLKYDMAKEIAEQITYQQLVNGQLQFEASLRDDPQNTWKLRYNYSQGLSLTSELQDAERSKAAYDKKFWKLKTSTQSFDLIMDSSLKILQGVNQGTDAAFKIWMMKNGSKGAGSSAMYNLGGSSSTSLPLFY